MNAPLSSPLQDFRNSVYHRFMVGAHRRLLPVEITQQRADRYQAWAQLERPQDLDADLVRHWAVADLMAYQEVGASSSQAVLDVMRANAARHAGYRASIQQLSPGLIAVGVDAPTYSRRAGSASALPLDLEPAQPPADVPAPASASADAAATPGTPVLPRLPTIQEQAAARAIEQTYERLATMPPDSLDASAAEHLVRADATSLSTIDSPAQRYFAAVAMGDSASRHDGYRIALDQHAPVVAQEVAAALREETRRAASRQQLELAKSEYLLLQIEQRGEGLEAASPAAVAESARADAQAVRQITAANERSLALLAMGWRAYGHDGYRAALRDAAPDVEKLASALQVRVEDGAYSLPRDSAEDALLDAAVRGLAPLQPDASQLSLPMLQTPSPLDVQAQRERDVQAIADFMQVYQNYRPAGVVRGLAQAPAEVRQLLRNEERVHELAAEVDAKLAHLPPARLARTRAIIATEFGHTDAQARRETADTQEAELAALVAAANRPDPAKTLERDAQLAADFVQEYHARTPEGIARGLERAPAPVRALLANELRMAEINTAVNAKLAHLNPAYVADTRAVIAAALKYQSAQELRAAADSQWAQLAQYRQVPFQSNALLLVRLQEDLNGMHHGDDGLTLQATSAADRNTVHFSINTVGSQSGGIAIIANPREMPVPAGWGQTDAWWRLRSHGEGTRAAPRSLPLGHAVIVAPVGTAVPEGARVVFYEGGAAARDSAIKQVFEQQRTQLHDASAWGWSDQTLDDHVRWRRDTSSRLWPGHAEHIRLDGYSGSTDHVLEDVNLDSMLADMRQRGPMYSDATGAEQPYTTVMEQRVSDIRASVNRLLREETPREDAQLIAGHYRRLVQQMESQLKTARSLDPAWQDEGFSFDAPKVTTGTLSGTLQPATAGLQEAVPAAAEPDADAAILASSQAALPAAVATPVPSTNIEVAAVPASPEPLPTAAAAAPAASTAAEQAFAPTAERDQLEPGAAPPSGDALVAQARLNLLRSAYLVHDPVDSLLAVDRDSQEFDKTCQEHLGFTLPRGWTGGVQVVPDSMYVEPGSNMGVDAGFFSVSVPRRSGPFAVVARFSDKGEAEALAQRLQWIAEHSALDLGEQDRVQLVTTEAAASDPSTSTAPVDTEAASVIAAQAVGEETYHVEQIRQRHAVLRDSGNAVADLDAADLSALAQADADALRQVRTQANLVAVVNDIMASVQQPAYMEALRSADYQVAKAVESIRFDVEVQERARRQARPSGIEGVLQEVGTALYEEHEGRSGVTHYMKYREDDGREGTAWGRGLPAALIGAGAQPGDRIRYSRRRVPPEVLSANQDDLRVDLAEFTVEVLAKAPQLAPSLGVEQQQQVLQQVGGANEAPTPAQPATAPVEQPPVTALQPAAVERPRVQVGTDPNGFMNQNAQQERDIADRRQLTGEMEDLFAQGHTVQTVVNALGPKLAFAGDRQDQRTFVNLVRATLGIPSQMTSEGQDEFKAWKAEYDKRQASSATITQQEQATAQASQAVQAPASGAAIPAPAASMAATLEAAQPVIAATSTDAQPPATATAPAPAAAPAPQTTQDRIHQDLLRRLAGRRARDSEQARAESGLATSTAQGEQAEAAGFAGDAQQPQQAPSAAARPRDANPAAGAPSSQPAAAGIPEQQGPRIRPALDRTLNGFTGDPADVRPRPAADICALLDDMTYTIAANKSVLYLLHGEPAFFDHGEQILMHKTLAPDNDDAVLTALMMAKEKWGGRFEITGTPEFQQRALALMVKHNLEVELTSPQQQAMRRQIARTAPDLAQGAASTDPVPLGGRPAAPASTSAAANSHSDEAAASAQPAARATTAAAQPAPVVAAAPASQNIGAQATASAPAAAASTGPHGEQLATQTTKRASPAAAVPAPAERTTTEAVASAAPTVAPEAQAVTATAELPEQDDAAANDSTDWQPLAADLVPIDARHYWDVQRAGVEDWFVGHEREAEMQRLGPQPEHGEVFWFDKQGRRYDPPEDAQEYQARLRSQPPVKHTGPAKVVLRGYRKNGDKNEVCALLFKGAGDFLQGYLTIEGKRQPVIAHIARRAPDSDTGEVRANYLRLSVNDGNPKHAQWHEIGYGNAINHRGDGKPVFFDEMLLNVGREKMKVRVNAAGDESLHRSLGFVQLPKQRGKDSSVHQLESSAPKAKPAAGEEVATGAPRKGSRRNARARAAA